MPVFPERESALINRLHSKGEKTQDKRTWIIGHQTENKGREAERFKGFRKGTADSTSIAPEAVTVAPVQPPPPPMPQRSVSTNGDTMMGTITSAPADDIMSSLAELDLTGNNVQDEPLLPDAHPKSIPNSAPQVNGNGTSNGIKHTATLGGVNPSLLAPLTVAPNIEKVRRPVSSPLLIDISQWLERLSYATEGVLYEDEYIQIGVKAEYHGHLGRLALFFGNKISAKFTNVSASIECRDPSAITAAFHDSPLSEISGLAQVQELIHVECKDVFTEAPILRLTYLAGSFTTVVLRLPVFLSRFVEGVTLEQAAFFERWKIIGGKSDGVRSDCWSDGRIRTTSRGPAHLPDQTHLIRRRRLGKTLKGH
jgi:AP-2 complex subunit alpha